MGREQIIPIVGIGEEIAPGSEIVGFDYILPATDETCLAQIASSLKRGIPEALSRLSLTVIANGPSARNVDLKSIKGHTLALNGAINLFLEQGVTPTYWAACDPQECVADMLPDSPPKNITYLVASKCHPRVFEKLKGCYVQLWHVKDHAAEDKARVVLASSITICATWLMHRLGFTDFEFYGWDGCFMDGRHHASGNADWGAPPLHINYGGVIDNGEVIGGRTFATTRTWAAEGEGAVQFFQLAEYFDINVKIHGDGMFACARESILKA